VRENRWLAGRYGIEAELIVEQADGRPARRSVRTLVAELVEQLGPTATELGTQHELDTVLAICEHGTGTARQRRVVEQGGTLHDVVNALVEELEHDHPPQR
jgi:gamma-glutamyl:cysteine ligase YbdK (ATP-grasp superfamily)